MAHCRTGDKPLLYSLMTQYTDAYACEGLKPRKNGGDQIEFLGT